MNADELKVRTGYAGKSQQWQYGFDLACREKKAELDALKAERDALLAAQQWQPIESAPRDGTDFLIDYEGVTIARWQPDGSQYPWLFLDSDFTLTRLREGVCGLVWRPKPLGYEAIAKARGDL